MFLGLVFSVSFDCPNLVNLATGLNRDSTYILSLESDCCSSAGITCDINQRVVGINWYGQGLTGYFNGSAVPLTTNAIDFGQNNIGRNFDGVHLIPMDIQTNITSISLYWNVYLTGPISFEWPTTLTRMELSWNYFNGTLPCFFPPNIRLLGLHANLQLTGPIPHLPSSLRAFWVYGNELYGDASFIPSGVTSLRLGADYNVRQQFTGILTLDKPTSIYARVNYLSGIVIGNTSALSYCDISDNPLWGNSNLENLTMCTQTGLYNLTDLPSTTAGVHMTCSLTETTSTSIKMTYTSIVLTAMSSQLTVSTTTSFVFTTTFPRSSSVAAYEWHFSTQNWETQQFNALPTAMIVVTYFSVLRLVVDYVVLLIICYKLVKRNHLKGSKPQSKISMSF